MPKIFLLYTIIALDGRQVFLATPFLTDLACPPHFFISAQEGRKDLLDTAKCSQWPHLCKCFEAT